MKALAPLVAQGYLRGVQLAGSAIGVVEQAYDVRTSNEQWLASIRQAAEESFGGRIAVQAYTFDVSSDGHFAVRDIASEPVWEELLRRAHASAQPEVIRDIYLRGPVRSVYQAVAGRRDDAGYQECVQAGIKEITLSLGVDPCGHGCALVFLQKDARRLPRGTRTALSRISAHLGSARRLRRTLDGTEADVVHGAEAILGSGGELLHAEGDARHADARRALREAARRMDHARRRHGEVDPVEALGLWRALVEGRWSLLEHFESDGRRILVARRNDPASQRNQALSEFERKVVALLAVGHSVKLCAYELGRAEGSISRLASSAMKKMGVQSRAQLIELHGAIVANDS